MCALAAPGMTGDFEMKKILFAPVAAIALTAAMPAAAADFGARFNSGSPLAYAVPGWTGVSADAGAIAGALAVIAMQSLAIS